MLILEAFSFGFVIPIFILHLAGRSPGTAGLGLPDSRGLGITILAVLFLVPAGFWLEATTQHPWGTPFYEVAELLTMIPEHFMLFGVMIALTFADRRLPGTAPVSAAAIGRMRWFPWGTRGVIAITVSGLLFFLIHIGPLPPLEIALAFPIGIVFAYLTLLTSSIWPSVLVHWALNLIPMACC
jgi:membrane protease YdiL (CAAX protease family)